MLLKPSQHSTNTSLFSGRLVDELYTWWQCQNHVNTSSPAHMYEGTKWWQYNMFVPLPITTFDTTALYFIFALVIFISYLTLSVLSVIPHVKSFNNSRTKLLNPCHGVHADSKVLANVQYTSEGKPPHCTTWMLDMYYSYS